ncbi:MAG: hypothetical protein ACQEW5_23335 [Bacillota bacterium]
MLANEYHAGITTVSKNPLSMEVWWIGDDGSVQGALGNLERQWRRFELGFRKSTTQDGRIDG